MGAGILVNAQDSQGSTPLHFAESCPSGRVEKVRLLVEYGVDREMLDKNGNTPTQIAAYYRDFHWWIEAMECGALTVKNN